MTDQVYIYALREKDTDEVRYVGQTRNLSSRLTSHLATGKIASVNRKDDWIGKTKARGGHIEMIVLEQCDPGYAVQRESYWLGYYMGAGHRLLNSDRPISPVTPHVFVRQKRYIPRIKLTNSAPKIAKPLTEEQLDILDEEWAYYS